VQAKQELEERVAKYDPNNDTVVEVRQATVASRV
jgi:hypothetical protein